MGKRTRALLLAATAQAQTYRQALRLIVTTAPHDSLVMGAVVVIRGLLPPVSVWLVKVVVDGVQERVSLGHLVLLVSLWAIATHRVGGSHGATVAVL